MSGKEDGYWTHDMEEQYAESLRRADRAEEAVREQNDELYRLRPEMQRRMEYVRDHGHSILRNVGYCYVHSMRWEDEDLIEQCPECNHRSIREIQRDTHISTFLRSIHQIQRHWTAALPHWEPPT